MKNIIKLAFVGIIVVAGLALGCSGSAGNGADTGTAPEVQTYKSIGVITAIDVQGGRVTVDHEEIPGYMMAMEMNEPVTDRGLLSGIKVGDKVEFEIRREGSAIKYSKFAKIGEVAAANGEKIYRVNCSECHGANGEGGKKGIPLVSGHALAHSVAEHIEQVTDGEDDKMPAFRDKLSTAEIAAVVKFVRENLQKNIPDEKRKQHHH